MPRHDPEHPAYTALRSGHHGLPALPRLRQRWLACHSPLFSDLQRLSTMNSLPQSTPTVPDRALASSAQSALWRPLAAAAGLGLVLLYGVAFAESPLAHNAAHDVRHVTVKPCH